MDIPNGPTTALQEGLVTPCPQCHLEHSALIDPLAARRHLLLRAERGAVGSRAENGHRLSQRVPQT